MPWVSGSAEGLAEHFVVLGAEYRAAAEAAMVEVVAEAVQEMQQRIKDATTPTGEARAGGGGEAGRIDTGEMYNAVRGEVIGGGDTIEGRFGWIDGFENYFMFQEGGTEYIEPMFALLQAFTRARENLDGKVLEIAR